MYLLETHLFCNAFLHWEAIYIWLHFNENIIYLNKTRLRVFDKDILSYKQTMSNLYVEINQFNWFNQINFSR